MGDLTPAADILDIHRIQGELDQSREWMRQLLARVGDEDKCPCGATIYFVRHRNGRSAPYEESGQIHFATCPKAAEFRRPKHRPEGV